MNADPETSTVALNRSLDTMARARLAKRKSRALVADKTLQKLVSALVAGRINAGMTQAEVAALMWTTKSAVCRLESGRCTRPNLSTIEKYALAIGCRVEVALRSAR